MSSIHARAGAQEPGGKLPWIEPEVTELVDRRRLEEVEADATIERAEGQRQLDEAAVLIRDAAALLRGYEKRHRDRADPASLKWAGHLGRADTLLKAETNAAMAARLEAWLPKPTEPTVEDDLVIAFSYAAMGFDLGRDTSGPVQAPEPTTGGLFPGDPGYQAPGPYPYDDERND